MPWLPFCLFLKFRLVRLRRNVPIATVINDCHRAIIRVNQQWAWETTEGRARMCDLNVVGSGTTRLVCDDHSATRTRGSGWYSGYIDKHHETRIAHTYVALGVRQQVDVGVDTVTTFERRADGRRDRALASRRGRLLV